MNSIKRVTIALFFLFQPLLIIGQGFNAELVNLNTNIKVKEGKLSKIESYEIRINNRGGEDLTLISIPCSPLSKVSNIIAYLKDSNGTIIKRLQKKDIIERSAISNGAFYEDDIVKEFTLKHNIYPYSIYYSFEVEEAEFLFIDYWIPSINYTVPTLSATLKVEVPSSYKLLFKSEGVDNFISDTSENAITFIWNASYHKLFKPEQLSPSNSCFIPKVVVVPVDYQFVNRGSFSTWKAFGEWHSNLIEGLSDLSAKDIYLIQNLVKGVNNDTEKVRILYDYLKKNTRYINISIETGGIKPYPASYVAEKKYGDCKALTNYFKSVLECVGIRSYYTLVYAGEPIRKIDREFPSQQFNHAILNVPMRDDTLWLDCTSKGPFNSLGSFTQNREVFIVDKDNSHFAFTPALSAGQVLDVRTINISMNSEGQTSAAFQNVYRGKSFELLNQIYNSANETQKLYYLRERFVPTGFDAFNFNIIHEDNDSSRFLLAFETSTSKLYSKYGREIIIDLLPFALPKFEVPNKRKLPIQIDCPIHQIDTLTYLVPEGYVVASPLYDLKIKNEYGDFSIIFHQFDNKIQVVKRLLINSGSYPLEKYPLFYDFIKEVKDAEANTHVVINQSIAK